MTKTNEAGKAAKTNNRRTGVRYRRSAVYVKELTPYIEALSDPQREFLMHRVQRIIIRAMRQDVTYRNCTSCKDIPMSRSARACTSTCPPFAGISSGESRK